MNRTVQSGHPKAVGRNGVFLTAAWQNLAMLNYEVDPRLLTSFIPDGTELDHWNGKTLISLVGFRFLQTKMLGLLPIPMHSNFDEVNLRFYVRRRADNQADAEVRRGVVFLRELVPRRAIAFVARTFYNESYVALPMAHEIRKVGDHDLSVAYRWRCGKCWNEINLETAGNPELAAEGTMEQFIAEHYWGYAAQPRGGCVEYRVTHPSWRVWQSRQSAFEGDGEEFYGKEIAEVLRGKPQSAFLAEGSAVTVMRGQRL